MEIQHTIQGSTLIIALLDKRFDVISSTQLKNKVLALIEESQLNDVILDLHHIEFIDSAGLVCFLSLWKELSRKKGNLKFASLTAQVRQVIELVLLNRVFDIYQDVDNALSDRI
ncbi:Anti-sigma factor antagonist [Chlamydiales bacterium STE3]|nr:Anti-sigma factor antagonist [Chlamydiales bacterium STE3]